MNKLCQSFGTCSNGIRSIFKFNSIKICLQELNLKIAQKSIQTCLQSAITARLTERSNSIRMHIFEKCNGKWPKTLNSLSSNHKVHLTVTAWMHTFVFRGHIQSQSLEATPPWVISDDIDFSKRWADEICNWLRVVRISYSRNDSKFYCLFVCWWPVNFYNIFIWPTSHCER